MKINEVKLVDSNTETKMGGTGFSIRVNNKYALLVEETTPLGFKVVNTIEVPFELSHELHEFLNEFVKKCVNELRNPSLAHGGINVSGGVTYAVDNSKDLKTTLNTQNWSDAINNQTI